MGDVISNCMKECPVCGKPGALRTYTFSDNLCLFSCSGCNLYFVSPITEGCIRFEMEYDALRYVMMPIVEGKVRQDREKIYAYYLKLVRQLCPSGRLLDVGSNAGFLLDLARKLGYETEGIEHSGVLAKFAREVLGLSVQNVPVEKANLREKEYDVVISSDAFEYFPYPLATVKMLHKALKTGGILLIKTPNVRFMMIKRLLGETILRRSGWESRIFGPTTRLFKYSDGSLRNLLEKNGFEIVRVMQGPVIQKPFWEKYTGLKLPQAMPLFMGWWRRLLAHLLYVVGQTEYYVTGRVGYFSTSLLIIAKKKS